MAMYIEVGIRMTKITMISNEEADTLQIAELIGSIVSAGDVVTLTGDLGVGKTVFAKGFAKGLQIEERITSPTFTIVKEYEGRLPLYHMDVYRLEHSEEDLGFDEYFFGEGVAIVEWAQFIEEFLPETYLAITIVRTGETSREITLEAVGEKYNSFLEQVRKSTLRSFIK